MRSKNKKIVNWVKEHVRPSIRLNTDNLEDEDWKTKVKTSVKNATYGIKFKFRF